jgi:acetoin utilization protein AcuB
MLVKDIMQSNLVTVTPLASLSEAMRLVGQRGIRHLPVVDGTRLVGILSDRDLKRAMASPATSLARAELNYLLDKLTVAEIMTRAVTTIGPGFAVEDAARIMVTQKISALPVTDGNRLVGLITETDVLDLFVRALGADEASSRLEVLLPDSPAALGALVKAVETVGTPICSIVTLRGRSDVREAIMRIATINPAPAIAALAAAGYSVREGSRTPG